MPTDQAPIPPSRTRIRERVRSGDLVVGAFMMSGSPLAVELAGRSGLDWLIIDLEHGAGTEADLLAQLYAAEQTTAAAIVRPEEGTRLRIGRVLDLGAEGVMIPRLEHPDEVRRVVSWLRYPPEGIRGLALLTRGAGLGEVPHGYVHELNQRVLGIFQVESPVAVSNAAEIAAIDGVDVLFVGPTDLSHSLRVPGRFDDPTYLEALRTVVAACRAAGKAPGILLRNTADAARHLEMGFTFVGLGSDSAFVADGARASVRALRGG